MTSAGAKLLQRLDAVEGRLEEHAASVPSFERLTSPDPPTGERWDVGQVWAHLAEFIPYWIGETQSVIDNGRHAAVPFGRTKSDPGRIAAIERDRRDDPIALWNRVRGDIASLRAFLEGIDDAGWSARGRHSTRGEMDVAHLVDEFLVGHLEQHADQLDGLAGVDV